MKLSFKEKIYCSVMWSLRHIFEWNYGKQKTKYEINSHDEYLLADKIAHMVSTCKSGWPKVDKFAVSSFKDALDLGAAVYKYERDHGIKWLTSSDRAGIETWREWSSSESTKARKNATLFYQLEFAILLEFL